MIKALTTSLFGTAWHGMAWYGMVWYGMAWDRTISHFHNLYIIINLQSLYRRMNISPPKHAIRFESAWHASSHQYYTQLAIDGGREANMLMITRYENLLLAFP